jgi:L-glyceraldehyde 3-phosphate reductase
LFIFGLDIPPQQKTKIILAGENTTMNYNPAPNRYKTMPYNRCGRSGLKLPAISLGLWHNFGDVDDFEAARKMIHKAFDLGITHFDLANNYGPSPGSAESTFGKILAQDFNKHRDEIVISTKAGWEMWPGPYGDFGSRKYLIASLDQSLMRLGVDCVDIYYHHRPDPETPLFETMSALDQIVRSGKALYVGISSYNAEQTKQAVKILKKLGTPCLIHQPKYNLFTRSIEKELMPVLQDEGIGCISFSPLAQGLLTDKYLKGIPKNSRAAKEHSYLKKNDITAKKLKVVAALNNLAIQRGQSLAQMAIAWNLRLKGMTSTIIGASRVEQIEDGVGALENREFTQEELDKIDAILSKAY